MPILNLKYFPGSHQRPLKEFILFDFIFWVLMAMIFPLAAGQLQVLNIVHLLLYFPAVYFVGELLFSRISAIDAIPFLFKVGVYIILGGIICGAVFLFIPSKLLLYAFSVFFFIELFTRNRIVFSFSFKEFLCLIPLFIILFQPFELIYATTQRFSPQDGDYFYYTAIVESIKSTHSINNAVYHNGIPINYVILPFLAPAQLAEFSRIPSQFALWGVYSKLIPLICFGLLSYVVVKLYEILFKVQLDKRRYVQSQFLVSCMLLLLGPLHFLKFVQLDFKNMLFLGEGYILPIGSPGFALAMLLTGLVLLLIFSEEKYTLQHRAVIILLLCLILLSKIALFLPLSVMVGCLSVFWLFKNKRDLVFTLLIAMPLCLLLYRYIIVDKDSIFATDLTLKGYFLNHYSTLADKYGIQGNALTKVFKMLGVSIFMWLSIKLFILVLASISLYKKNFKAISLIIGTIFCFFISLLPGFILNIYGRDSKGIVLFDGRFDTSQFVRGSIFLITVVSLVFVLYLIYNHKRSMIRKGVLMLVFIWMGLISYSFFATNYNPPVSMDHTWYKEMIQDFYNKKPKLMAMMGNYRYSGQTLTGAGIHPWYCTGTREAREGQIMTISAYERNIFFQRIFDQKIPLYMRMAMMDSLKNQGVDCIVASPSTMPAIRAAEGDSLISLISGAKWLYNIN